MILHELTVSVSELFGGEDASITINDGITTFVGPNGSGKSKTLRQVKDVLQRQIDGEVLLLPAGRLKPLEQKRLVENPTHSVDTGNIDLTMREDRRDRWSQVESVKGILNRMSDRVDVQIKVAERLRSLFGREIDIDWERGNLKLRFARNGEEYSGEKESSGLLHTVGILAALYDDALEAVLLDEPDISLHPQLQSFLLREMESVAGNPEEGGKIIVMATHSPAMVQIDSPDDLPRFVFFNDADTPPEQVDPGAGILRSNDLGGLVRNLGSSHREALFAQRPLLVEGKNDATVIEALDSALSTHLDAAGGHVLPVGGTGEISAAVQFCQLAGKQPCVLADLDAFTDDLDLAGEFDGVEGGEEAAADRGHNSFLGAVQSVHNSLDSAVQNHWGSIRPHAEQHAYWSEPGDEEAPDISRRRRAAAAVLLSEDHDNVRTWSNDQMDWLSLRTQLEAILGLMEAAGCFVLRRGEIEDTYADLSSRENKTEEAEEEARQIRNDPASAEARHPVAVRAIKHVAESPEIDESGVVMDKFSAVVATVLSLLRRDEEATTEDLEAVASQNAGESAQLFDLTRVDDGANPAVRVELNATVLDVEGFPITVRAGDDVKTVASQCISSVGEND